MEGEFPSTSQTHHPNKSSSFLVHTITNKEPCIRLSPAERGPK